MTHATTLATLTATALLVAGCSSTPTGPTAADLEVCDTIYGDTTSVEAAVTLIPALARKATTPELRDALAGVQAGLDTNDPDKATTSLDQVMALCYEYQGR